jgi:hypothetical protein
VAHWANENPLILHYYNRQHIIKQHTIINFCLLPFLHYTPLEVCLIKSKDWLPYRNHHNFLLACSGLFSTAKTGIMESIPYVLRDTGLLRSSLLGGLGTRVWRLDAQNCTPGDLQRKTYAQHKIRSRLFSRTNTTSNYELVSLKDDLRGLRTFIGRIDSHVDYIAQ